MVRGVELALPVLLAVGSELAVMGIRAVDLVAPDLARALCGAHEEPVDLELGRREVVGAVLEVARLGALVGPGKVARVAELEAVVLVLDARVVPVKQLRRRRPQGLVHALTFLVDEVVFPPRGAGRPLARRDVDGLVQWHAALPDSRPCGPWP